MAGGRPTEYSEDTLKQSDEYIDSCEDEEVQELTGLSAKGTELYKTKLNVNIPSIEGLAFYLGVSRDTLYEWEKVHPEFSYTLSKLRAKQGSALISKGLSGDYNSTIAKLLLSSNHGMREKSDMTTDGDKLPTPIINVLSNDSNQESNGAEEKN